jgi:hypothetical protein
LLSVEVEPLLIAWVSYLPVMMKLQVPMKVEPLVVFVVASLFGEGSAPCVFWGFISFFETTPLRFSVNAEPLEIFGVCFLFETICLRSHEGYAPCNFWVFVSF